MRNHLQPELAVAIGSVGAIGRKVAAKLDEGIPGLRLAAVSARDAAKAKGCKVSGDTFDLCGVTFGLVA